MNGTKDKTLAALKKTFAATVKKVTKDTANLDFNTAISQMMIFINELSKQDTLPDAMWSDFVKMLSVYAPHLGEELWQKLGHDDTIAYEPWPRFNESDLTDDVKTIVVMVNGKLRGKFEAASGAPKAELEAAAKTADGVEKFLEGKKIVKTVIVENKLVNFVVS